MCVAAVYLEAAESSSGGNRVKISPSHWLSRGEKSTNQLLTLSSCDKRCAHDITHACMHTSLCILSIYI